MSEWSLSQRKQRRIQLAIFLPLFLVGAIVGGFAFGAVVISPQDIWNVILGNNDSLGETILLNVRLPRVILAAIAGACLAASGAILQGIMQNPLADPSIIGVTSGGGLAASFAMVAFPQIGYLLPTLAFVGSFLTSLVIYLFAWDKGASPVKIILAGVAINAMLGAVQSGIMILYSDRVQGVLPWLAGGFQGKGWYHVEFVLPFAVAGLLLSLLTIKPINLLLLGDEAAQLLGTPVERLRLLLILLAALLAGAAVSVAGLVGFVGLVVPHMIRLYIGGDYRLLLPFSMLGGAALVIFTDTIARTVFDPIELPVGILLACMGAPFFLYLLKKRGLLF